MKNIHLIPTDKPSKYVNNYMEQTMQWQNIYITSDEEIKEGDYIFETDINITNIADKDYYRNEFDFKIILTTDQSLDSVQAIDDEFLLWFVQNPSCEEVEVQKFNGFAEDYLIIIPKEEPKQELYVKKGLDYMINLEEPKQKTLEEAAERILANNVDGLSELLRDDDLFFFYKGVIQCYGEAMAEWQAERMYSEEDMREAFYMGGKHIATEGKIYEQFPNFEIWFEQFKNKTQ